MVEIDHRAPSGKGGSTPSWRRTPLNLHSRWASCPPCTPSRGWGRDCPESHRSDTAQPQCMAHDRGRTTSHPSGDRTRRGPPVAYAAAMPAPIRLGTCSWADQGLIETLVPDHREERRGPAALLRRALRHGRGELVVLRDSRGGDGDELGRADAGRVHLPREGVRDDDGPPRAARAAAGRPADARLRCHVARATSTRPRRCSSACSGASGRRSIRSRRPARLGGVLMQYGPSFDAVRRGRARSSRCGAELLAPYPVLVEFRQRDWLSGGERRGDARVPHAPGTSRT